ncbi:MAG: hypothetical protein K1X81_01980 [Bacteroidia bacterium]|nr:hypothetical protein [Bacteroidia bacterium]
MKQYSVTSPKMGGEIIFRYDEERNLTGFDFGPEVDKISRMWVLEHLPVWENALLAWPSKSPHIKVTEIPQDLSFESFWNRYAYKVGDKSKAKKLWEKLGDTEKTKCLNSINRYNIYLRDTSIAKVYPERYLSQQRYNNDFKQ